MFYFLIVLFACVESSSAEEIEKKALIIDKKQILVDRLKQFDNKTKFKKFFRKPDLEGNHKSKSYSESADFPYSKFHGFRAESYQKQSTKYYLPPTEPIVKDKNGGEAEIRKFLETKKINYKPN